MGEGNKYHYLVSALLGVAGLVIILIFVVVRSQADQVDTSVGVINSLPTVSITDIGSAPGGAEYNNGASGIDLNQNSTESVHISGVLTDPNGYEEIDQTDQVELTFYKDASAFECNVNEPGGISDPQNCYYATGADCTVDSCSGTTCNYNCDIPLQYYASTGTWYASAKVTDDPSDTGNVTSSIYAIVNTLTALNVTESSINWNTLGVGEVSADVPLTVENSGNNNDLDIALSATDMFCSTRGSIPSANIKYATGTNAQFTYANKSGTMSTGPASFNLSLTSGINGQPYPSEEIQFQVQIPATGVAGSCSGTLTLMTD